MRNPRAIAPAFALLLGACAMTPNDRGAENPSRPPRPTTAPERSDYRRTSTPEETSAFLDACVAAAPGLLRRASIGRTTEGRDLALVLAADPPVEDLSAARKDGRPVVFVMANIHSGECEGKEATQEILRDVAFDGGLSDVLKRTIVAFLPNYNPDGDAAVDRRNRPDQAGPIEGVGRRSNGAGLDLNRDFIKAVAPETRALLRATNALDPLLVVDCHATNGSFHGYDLTYAGPLHPATDARLLDYVRGTFLPKMRAAMRARGFDAFDYGNWVDPKAPEKGWETFESKPRFSNSYFGLKNRFTLLSEAYSHDPFQKRIASTRALIVAALRHVAAYGDEMRAIADAADRDASEPSGARRWPLRGVLAQTGFEDVPVGGVREEVDPVTGLTRQWDTDVATPVRMPVFAHFDPAEIVPVPEGGWAIPKPSDAVLDHLALHGIAFRRLKRPTTVLARVFRVEATKRAATPFQNVRTTELEGRDVFLKVDLEAGAAFIPSKQKAARLAFILLEPRSEDGWSVWGISGSRTTVDGDAVFDVVRLEAVPTAEID
jgi:hypothetical protein